MIETEKNIHNREIIQFSDRTQYAMWVAVEAGRSLVAKPGDNVQVKDGVSNVVTEGDMRSDVIITNRLNEQFPGEAIISEERVGTEADVDYTAEKLWIVDPLDGSKNQQDGIPNVCVSIAYAEGGSVVSGVIYNPYTREMYIAEKGKGAKYIGPNNEKNEMEIVPIHVSDTPDLSRASIETSMSYDVRDTIDHELIKLAMLTNGKTPRFREIGSSVEQLARVAKGVSDVHMHKALKPWDYAAAKVIVEEAGGVFKRFDGSAGEFWHADNVSGPAKLVDQVVAVIQGVQGNQGLVEDISNRIKAFNA